VSTIKLSKKELKKICKKWLKNKNVNPIDNKPIRPNLKIYKELVKSCADYKSLSGAQQSVNLTNSIKTKPAPQPTGASKNMVKVDGLPFEVPKVTKKIMNTNIVIPQQIKQWVLGRSYGQGGFGQVFECFDIKDPYSAPKAIKIETASSSGLFIETHFYRQVKNYKNKYIPVVYDYAVKDGLRYLVMETLKPFVFSYEKLPDIIRGLETFADMNRTHGDVKFDNLMQRENGETVFVDFGISWKIDPTKYSPDPKKISGTLLYMSVYAHNGVITYANDLESLLYSILNLVNKLPWSSSKTFAQLKKVEQQKRDFIMKIRDEDPKVMKEYKLDSISRLHVFAYMVTDLDVHEKPNYDALVKLFR
jgi:hypothetical protein